MILHVGAFPFPLPQGSQVFVDGQCRALLRRGLSIELACYDSGVGESAIPLLRTPDRGLPGDLRSGPSWTKVPRDLDLWRVVRARVRRGDVALVHAHNVEAPIIAALAALRPRPILVYQLHTTMADELPTYARHLGRLARGLGEAIDRLVPELCDATLGMSDGAMRALGRASAPAFRVEPGVDLADLTGADPARGRARLRLDDRPWVIYAGNLDGYQDLPILFEAVRAHPTAGLAIVTHGRGDPAPPLPPARYRFFGEATFADVKDALAAATIAAVPRQICAGTPIKLLNQLGLGVPTVAVRGAAPDLPGTFLAEPGVVGFGAALRAALAADRSSIAAEARDHVRAACTWNARAAELAAVYDFVSHRRRIRRIGWRT